jgi:iron uptake system component EfeO
MSRLSPRQRLGIVVGVLGAVLVAAVVTAIAIRPAEPAAASREAGPIAITAGTDRCAPQWTSSPGGPQTFAVTNSSVGALELYLEDPSTGDVFIELEGIGPGATQDVSAVLGDGRYDFVCLGEDASPTSGPTVVVSGVGQRSDLTPGVKPVTSNDLASAVTAYKAWISGQLPILQSEVQSLAAALHAGDIAGAKAAWLTGHTQYESLGAAYGAFGDADSDINGSPAPGLTALDDPDLTGFHKIEALLWSGADPATIADVGDKLVSDVNGLVAEFGAARLDPLDIGLRSHEILENAIEFELTGSTDAGSGTSLATIDANLVGTVQAYIPLRQILSDRGYDLQTTDQWLDRSKQLVESFKQADGSWTPLSQLSQADKEKLDATLGQTVELLAPIAAICDVRRGADQ